MVHIRKEACDNCRNNNPFRNWQVPITSAEYYHSSRPHRGELQAAFCLVIFLFLRASI